MNRERDQDYPSIITGYDFIKNKKPTEFKLSRILKTARKLLFYILIPLLLPIYLPLIILLLGTQGISSRLRVKKILKKQKDKSSFSYSTISIESDSTIDQNNDDDNDHSNPILSATLDVMNMAPDDDQDNTKEHKAPHTLSKI